MNTNILVTENARYRHPVFYLLLLGIIVCIAWWPISFNLFSLKNDALNYFLPVRRLVSESYYEGYFPGWTPYLNLGYPLYGDMQSGVWNPIVQLFSLFGPYTLLTLQIETLVYVFLSGAGMFYLLRYFKTHPHVNITIASGYMLCGFNSDSAQFLNWIAGASFLPFVFLFYYRGLREQKAGWMIASAISLYLYFTCAYPADFVILIYLLIAVLIGYGIKKGNFLKHIVQNKTFWVNHALLFVCFLLFCLPAIVSFFENLPLTERGNGASYQEAMSNPLHPALLSSYLYPPSTWKMPGISVTDPLERNSFFGLLPFIFFIAGLLSKSVSSLSRFYKIAVIIFLLFSFGEIGGIRIISYYLLPLMNTFRHPANAKLFTIFFSCLLAAEYFQQQTRSANFLPQLKTAFYVIGGLIFLTFFASLFTPLKLFSLFNNSADKSLSFASLLKHTIEQLTYADFIIICALLQAPFLLIGWKFLQRKNYKRIAYVSILNSIIFCMLMQPLTVVKNQKTSDIQNLIDSVTVKEYPKPDLTKTLNQNSEGDEQFFNDIGCQNLYNKRIGRSEYRITPSNLNLQNMFWNNDYMRDFVMQKPLLYNIVKNQTDIGLTSFTPLTIEGKITAKQIDTVILSQTIHPRWQLILDGKKHKIDNINIAFMSFAVEPGIHSFSFHFKTGDLKILSLLSHIALAVAIIFLISFILRRKI